jgi:hypothetical protein
MEPPEAVAVAEYPPVDSRPAPGEPTGEEREPLTESWREPTPERPEISSLPLFALTAPGPDSADEESEPESRPSPEVTEISRPRGTSRWIAAAVAVAVLAAIVMLGRRRSLVPGAPPAPAPISGPSTGPRSESNPVAKRTGSTAAKERPSTASEPSGAAAEPQIVVSRLPEPRSAPSPGSHAPGRWAALAEAGRRAFEHPGAHRYAVQVELACEESTLQKAFAADPGLHRIWVAPYEFRGRNCYRVLWGKFDDLASAKSAKKTIPPIFSRGGNRPAVIALGRADRGERR